MPRHPHRRLTCGGLRSALVALAAALWLSMAAPAAAHTEVQRAEPGPGQSVTAPISSLSLRFLDPVAAGVTITIEDDAGAAVPGLRAPRQSADRRDVTVAFDPITTTGDYIVSFEFVAPDGARQRDAYQFTVAGDGERSTTAGFPVGAAVLGVVLTALLVVAMVRRRQWPSDDPPSQRPPCEVIASHRPDK